MLKQNWRLLLPLDTTVFCTVDLSRDINRITIYIKHAEELKAYHQTNCGVLLNLNRLWKKDDLVKLRKALDSIENIYYSLEKCRQDEKIIILYF